MTHAPRVAFLGVCEQGRLALTPNPNVFHYDVIGLRTCVLSYIYPLVMDPFQCVIAAYDLAASPLGPIEFQNASGDLVYKIDITAAVEPEPGADPSAQLPGPVSVVALQAVPSWTVLLLPLRSLIVVESQILSVHYVEQGTDHNLGQLVFGTIRVAALSEERIAALKSDPTAAKTAVLVMACKLCGDRLPIYASLEKKNSPPEGATWYQDVPDEFRCKCGSTVFPLSLIRQNMHALLGARTVPIGSVSFTDMYEKRALEEVSRNFVALLEGSPTEETVQQFLAANTVFFHPWSPQRIFTKPPILTRFKADFGLLDGKGTLFLVEIERPSLPLTVKSGDPSAELNHAIAQVEDWLFEYSRHQTAILDAFSLTPSEVAKVRGIVIAGRNSASNQKDLHRLKWQDRGPIDFLTYDDLLSTLVSLATEMRKI